QLHLEPRPVPAGAGGGGEGGAQRRAERRADRPARAGRPTLAASPVPPSMNPSPVALITSYRRPAHPMAPSPATIERFLAHCHRRRYPPRTEVFRPGDPAGTLYYVISGSVSIITEEDDGRELVLGY